jgi:DNA-binding response OmpR family regulator
VSEHPAFINTERTRTSLSCSAALQTPFANPILLVDPHVDLGRGLLQQLTRHGFCADLAITVDAARACVRVRYYRAMVVVADLSDCQHLFGLGQLREAAPQTWIIIIATNTDFEACQAAFRHGADACLPKPFQFSNLLFRLESLSHDGRRV